MFTSLDDLYFVSAYGAPGTRATEVQTALIEYFGARGTWN